MLKWAVSGEIAAINVDFDEYMESYAHDGYEWVDGVVVKVSPISDKHDILVAYLSDLLRSYLELRPIGVVRHQPFVMKLPTIRRGREPDIQVILDSNPHEYTKTGMIGPADICIEVVSPESITRDYEFKYAEYEAGGVGEYWIIDPLEKRCTFYRQSEAGGFVAVRPDADENYHTPRLPGLAVQVPLLWHEELPGPGATFQAVQAMLGRA